MYLLATITLYFSVWSVISLLFDYTNIAFPDPLNPYYDAGGSIRWELALLVIIFPVYFWLSRFLRGELVKEPAKSEIKVRKWLLYLTLFVAALLIIGDLVALIYNFLGGELTMRFLLKILSVLAVAAGVFWYYLYDLRNGGVALSSRAKFTALSIAAAVVVIAVAGFFVAGSPFRQRLVRFDGQKVNDLQVLQSQIVNYWIQKGVLPTTLGDLRDTISGFIPPTDPQSGSSYGYKATAKLSFELCADFNLTSAEAQIGPSRAIPTPIGKGDISESWDHEIGNQCFSRTIDPELYRQKPPIMR